MHRREYKHAMQLDACIISWTITSQLSSTSKHHINAIKTSKTINDLLKGYMRIECISNTSHVEHAMLCIKILCATHYIYIYVLPNM